MLLAAAAVTWILTISAPDGVSTVQYDSQEACNQARQEYEDQFTEPREHKRHHAECSLSPVDTME